MDFKPKKKLLMTSSILPTLKGGSLLKTKINVINENNINENNIKEIKYILSGKLIKIKRKSL